jgi:hypothetical protein
MLASGSFWKYNFSARSACVYQKLDSAISVVKSAENGL